MTSEQSVFVLFASTSRGLEELLKEELSRLGATECRIAQGGVHFSATKEVLYHTLLWSLLASRISLSLTTFPVYSDSDLYLGASMFAWHRYFAANCSFVVHFTGTNTEIRHTQYGALKIKDAIADSFMRKVQQRPSVDKEDAEIRIRAYLDKERVHLMLDLSGESLHQHGYRTATGIAPLKENLAAAMLLRSTWKKSQPLLDPMCGSGTLLIEAAMMAADIAPRLSRKKWGFLAWTGHDAAVWQAVIQEAEARAVEGLKQVTTHLFGFDNSDKMISIAQENAKRAGVASLITFVVRDVGALSNPYPAEQKGVVISNPPYGERLDSEPELIALYSTLGACLKEVFPGWMLSIISASSELLSCLRLRSSRQFKMKNGPLDCIQKNYSLTPPDSMKKEIALAASSESREIVAQDFANRFKKNIKKLARWALQEGIECYRLYDADLPDYNVAIDRYKDKIVIQEYAAPSHIDPNRAKQRVVDVIRAVMVVLNLSASDVIYKVRERKKGKSQYEKLAVNGEFFLVKEYQAKLWVNLTDYLDTGLFLDHRITRRWIAEQCKGKDFLNLFCYTASATVHVGLAGAKTTTSIDLSNTYLEWAERNLETNSLTGYQHRLIQADCLEWLATTTETFEVIFIDPPTFSNSKRMQADFDIQRDYLDLFRDLSRILRKEGVVIFSNNKRGFKLDSDAVTNLGFSAENITEQTRSLDFQRNRAIHNCWVLKKLSTN